MKRFILRTFLLMVSLLVSFNVSPNDLVKEGFLLDFSDSSVFKDIGELKKCYENFYSNKEEQYLSDILRDLGVSRYEFDQMIKEREEGRRKSFKEHKTTDYFKKIECIENSQRLRVIELFGYDPYQIIEEQLRNIGKAPSDYLICAFFDLDEPEDDDSSSGFYVGYLYSIYFPKTNFSKEEFMAAMAHEMQHIKHKDFSRYSCLSDLVLRCNSEVVKNKFKKMVYLTEIRSDILGSMQDLSYAKGALSSFEKEIKSLPEVMITDDEHPSHFNRIGYLSELVKQMEILSNKRIEK